VIEIWRTWIYEGYFQIDLVSNREPHKSGAGGVDELVSVLLNDCDVLAAMWRAMHV